MKFVDVKQGYTKCSTLIADENSVITSDKGLYRVYEKNGVEYILVRYKLDANDAVKAITLFAGEKYLTAGESVLIEKTQAFYDALTNAEIQIKYNVNELFEDQIATFTGFEVTVTTGYAFDELEYSFDSFVNGLFQ